LITNSQGRHQAALLARPRIDVDAAAGEIQASSLGQLLRSAWGARPISALRALKHDARHARKLSMVELKKWCTYSGPRDRWDAR